MGSDQNVSCRPPRPRRKRKRAQLACLFRAATREEGGIHPPPLKSRCARAPQPQAPLLLCTAASGPQAERSGTAGGGAAAGGGGATEGGRGRRRSSHEWSSEVATSSTAAAAVGQTHFECSIGWRLTILGSSSNKPRCSIWPNRSAIWSTSPGDSLTVIPIENLTEGNKYDSNVSPCGEMNRLSSPSDSCKEDIFRRLFYCLLYLVTNGSFVSGFDTPTGSKFYLLLTMHVSCLHNSTCREWLVWWNTHIWPRWKQRGV
jgi:hypothetical protein